MPDLNSVPPSPRVLVTTRQSAASFSNQIAHPPVPPSPSSIHVFPSNQIAVSQGTPVTASLPSPYFPPSAGLPGSGPPGDGPGVGPGPGPLRHPRPLTAAELHMQLEKEQEAVVNRLTRELTLLRAQNASVVSNASSASAGAGSDASAPSAAPAQDAHSFLSGASGFSIPSSAGRHNRTYSNTSTRSQTAAAGHSVVGITAPAPIRPTAPVPIRQSAAPGMSRQNSTASRRSRTNSPGPSSYSHSYDSVGASYFQQHQQQTAHGLRGSMVTPSSSDMSPAIVPGTARYEETAFYRAELESVKRENEALRRRIRELERTAAAATAAAAAATATAATATAAAAATATASVTATVAAVAGASTTGASSSSVTAAAGSTSSSHQRRRTSDSSHARSESASTTASMNTGHMGSAISGGGGARIAAPRESGRERVTSMLSMTGSVAGSVGVGVPEDELQVGESAASAGLHDAQEASSSNRSQTGQQRPQAAN